MYRCLVCAFEYEVIPWKGLVIKAPQEETTLGWEQLSVAYQNQLINAFQLLNNNCDEDTCI